MAIAASDAAVTLGKTSQKESPSGLTIWPSCAAATRDTSSRWAARTALRSDSGRARNRAVEPLMSVFMRTVARRVTIVCRPTLCGLAGPAPWPSRRQRRRECGRSPGALDPEAEADARGVPEALRLGRVGAWQVLDRREAEVPPLVERGLLGQPPDLLQRPLDARLDVDARHGSMMGRPRPGPKSTAGDAATSPVIRRQPRHGGG